MNMKNVFAASLIAGLIAGSAQAQTGTDTHHDAAAPKKEEHKDANACNGKDANSCSAEMKKEHEGKEHHGKKHHEGKEEGKEHHDKKDHKGKKHHEEKAAEGEAKH